MKLRIPFLLALGIALVLAGAAPAVIIDSGDGTGNTSAPAPVDPGWDNVGTLDGAYGAIYLGSGWVLTANHVGAGDTDFGGVLYPWVPGSDVRLHNPDTSLADLVMFHIYPSYPPLAGLPIRATAPPMGTDLVLIGYGRNRSVDPTTWDPPGPASYDGYLWDPGAAMRWGTNTVQIPSIFTPPPPDGFNTQIFGTVFDQSGGGHTTHEAQGATGDSGGAVFAWNGTSYDLAGILIGIGTYRVLFQGTYYDQPAGTALYGNETYAADLSTYRDEIVETMPEPAGGLFAGAALLAVLPSAGTRRACRGTGCAASSPRRA